VNYLAGAGVNVRGWSDDKILSYRSDGNRWSTRVGGLMTTTALPVLLLGVGQRVLENSYRLASSPLKSYSRGA
jgi:hypothetical protein